MKKNYIGVAFAFSVFYIIYSLIAGIDIVFFGVLSIWLIGMGYACKDLKRRLLLAVFLTSFFIFLLGGHLVYEYFGMNLNYYLGDDYYLHSNVCLLISLIFVLLGFFVTSKFDFERKAPEVSSKFIKSSKETGRTMVQSEETVLKIRKASVFLYYITYPIWIYIILEKATFVQTNSYYSYYTDYTSNAPYFIRAIASMTPFFLYLFLATMPSKKESRLPLLLYILYAVVSIFTGRRSNMTFMIIFFIAYILFRHFKDGKEAGWIKKRDIILAVIGMPLLIMFLYIYNFIRMGTQITDLSIKDMFLGFFQQQGFSSSLIRLGKYHASELRENAYYSFFGIVKFFRTNTIMKLIFNFQYDFSYLRNDYDFATKGNSLANALSYIRLWAYSKGMGLGTCYIAELYYDFGYIGVAVGNLFYGVVINGICKIWNKTKNFNVWATAIGFALVESFIKAPRWNFDIIISYFLDLGMWMAFGSVFVLSLIIGGVKKGNGKEIGKK